jgi:hypothetical protein
VLLGLAFCCYTPIITFHLFGVCELPFTWSYDYCFEIEFNLGGTLIKPLMRKRGAGCINSCKFLQLFFARKHAQFCACCFHVSFDFYHFSHFEITICNLSVPWFKVVLGSHDSFMHSMSLGCTLLITNMLLLMYFTISMLLKLY